VANNVNKFAVIILSELFVQRTLGMASSTGTLVVMFFGWFYAQTKGAYSNGRLAALFRRLGMPMVIVVAVAVLGLLLLVDPDARRGTNEAAGGDNEAMVPTSEGNAA
jgi:hypothetical protein